MKIKDLTIRTRLLLGFGAILVMVILLGALASVQTWRIWQNTHYLYKHPFTVNVAVREIETNIMAIHRSMKDVVLAENPAEIGYAVHRIEIREAEIGQLLDKVYERYLGNKEDVDHVVTAFRDWKGYYRETIRICREGKIREAVERTKGAGAEKAEAVLKEVKVVEDFAMKRATSFYAAAREDKNYLETTLWIVLAAIVALTILIIFFILRSIAKPLKELTDVVNRQEEGDYDARSAYDYTNEIGELAFAFNRMADTIQGQMKTKSSVAAIADAMLGNEELMAFCRGLMQELLPLTDSNMGALYFLHEEKGLFEPYYTVGLLQDKMRSFSLEANEGEFGSVLTRKTITRISAIPDDTIFDFATAVGNFKPKEIITIPIMQFEKVVAVISLASLKAYSEEALAIINNSWKNLNIGFIGILAFENIREYSRKLDRQNEQLEEQAETLKAQAEELRDNNQELQAQQEELEAQAEELRKQSEELKRQNVILEKQRLAVEEANRLKSQFFSNMSHELRTPLNSVMALSRVLMMQAKTKLSYEEVNYLEIIERNGKNLLALINDILDLSKIEAGRMDVNPKLFALPLTLENIIEGIMPIAGEKNIEINQNIPDDIPVIESDEVRLSQILQNLLANAVKFTNAGSVTVSVTCNGKNVFVRIEDTGIGISEKDLPYIFDEFRQADGTSSRRHEGTGLGLAIARKAARILGGDITVTSVPEKGSVFTLTLPVVWQGKAPVYEPIVARQPLKVRPARKTILVVDDEPEMAAMISGYLLREGYNTLTATSGAEALKLAAWERPFAITLDVIMPDMDGWETLQNLKKNPDTRDIPVIIVSISEGRETGFALGAMGYVTKPVSGKQLVSEIQKIGKPQTRSIMIVDDNKTDRQEIRRIVEEEGLKTIEAENGAACLELIEKEIPDILILDLMMPEPDGFAVLEQIRVNPETRELPVIVVTAKDLTEEDRKRLRGNASSVLEKSAVKSETLLEEIKRILIDLEKSAALPRILIVEDNEAAIIQVKAVLESAGYTAHVARGGQEAIDYVSRIIPDAIILDLMMPEIDGFAVLERIRGTKATLGIPVLILTAKDLTPEDFKKLSANHIQQLVQKGDIDRDTLLSKIKSMLAGGEGEGGSDT
jgi:signal transduction histidine kinase/CheY-like chemotaxis protein